MLATAGIFLFLIARVAGASLAKGLLSSVVFTAFFWLVFAKILRIPLPGGIVLKHLLGG